MKAIRCGIRVLTALIAVAIITAGASPLPAQDETVPFDAEHWDLLPGGKVVEFLGRTCLIGGADLKGVSLRNGVVEVDIAFSEGRNFPGIAFHKKDAENYEEFYVRPHKPGDPDALQYTPVFNGLSAWQLYYGEGYTGAWTFPMGEWVRFKLEISGSKARVFIGETERPALVISDLKHGEMEGGLGLKVTGPPGLAHFSNFRFREDDSIQIEVPPQPPAPFGMLRDWEIAPPFKYNMVDMKRYPGGLMEGVEWNAVQSEPSGLVNLSRWLGKSPAVAGCALARTTLRAEEAGPMQLRFGYSDQVSIFLNRRLLFSGSSVFRERDPFFQGYAGLFDSVWLPLKKGENELLLVVAESSGGWGFLCRNGDAEDLAEGVRPVWELSHRLSYPETAVYDPVRAVLYVSNYYGDGPRALSRLSLKGEILEREWVTGLIRPTGMALSGDTLYVVERTGVAEIDIPSESISNRYPFTSPGFPNDAAVDAAGRIYVSDGRKACILRYEDGAWAEWMKGAELAGVNGLHHFEGRLYVGCGADASLKWVDLKAEEPRLEPLARLDPGAIVDGIENDEKGRILVSDFNGKVYRIEKDGEKIQLLDTTATQKTCANFAYVPKLKLLVIPTLSDNRVMAYRLED